MFFLIEATALAGMVETPSMMVGVTSTSSQTIGTLAAVKICLTDSEISGPIPCSRQRRISLQFAKWEEFEMIETHVTGDEGYVKGSYRMQRISQDAPE